ncbi:hypothetical protein GCM10022384_01270 [Streptomyces marokkonensis]|uniref:Uncharacterized protein n=1 Tax=Streptomyces marokkonensis TaxID=324855 RepID=A0ABP7NP45_9ACTN
MAQPAPDVRAGRASGAVFETLPDGPHLCLPGSAALPALAAPTAMVLPHRRPTYQTCRRLRCFDVPDLPDASDAASARAHRDGPPRAPQLLRHFSLNSP